MSEFIEAPSIGASPLIRQTEKRLCQHLWGTETSFRRKKVGGGVVHKKPFRGLAKRDKQPVKEAIWKGHGDGRQKRIQSQMFIGSFDHVSCFGQAPRPPWRQYLMSGPRERGLR